MAETGAAAAAPELKAVVSRAPLPAVARAAALFGGADGSDTPTERFLYAHFASIFDGRPPWDASYALIDEWVAVLGTVAGVDAVVRQFGCHLHDYGAAAPSDRRLPPPPTVSASGGGGGTAAVATRAVGCGCQACPHELLISDEQLARMRHKGVLLIGTTATSLVITAALTAESVYRKQCEAAALPAARRPRSIVVSRRVSAGAPAAEKERLYTAYVLLANYLERVGLAGATVERDDAQSWSAWFHNSCTFTLTVPVSTAPPPPPPPREAAAPPQ